jgi:hypothetical protein
VSIYFNKLDRVVFFTIAYSDYFDFPLIKKEILSRLPRVWDWKFFTGQKINSTELKINKEKEALENSLEKLLKNKKIEKIKKNNLNYYFLKGREEIIQLRIDRKKIAKKRQIAIDGFINLVKKIPTINAVVLTGSSATKNASFNDDLDFCLITRRNTLWISRFFLIFLAKILGKRPQIDAQSKIDSKQAWCFNLWLDESCLAIINRNFSIYQAYEVKQMLWLFDEKKLRNHFLQQNKQLDELIELNLAKKSYKKRNHQFLDYFFWPINLFFYYLQNIYRYLLFGKENYHLNLYQAHFNAIERQQDIFLEIKKKMKKNGLFSL